MADTQDTRMHEFFNQQHERLNQIEASLVNTHLKFDAARAQATANVEATRDRAAATRDAHQKQFEDGVAQMKSRLQALKQQTQTKVENWKQQREIDKLEDLAAMDEAYAEASLYVAANALEEARIAVADAIATRIEAEEAKRAATGGT
jgi:hypothetical protein